MSTPPALKSAPPPAAVDVLLSGQRPLVIAHRGYSQLAAENTLPAFQLAKTAGADLVELDYHHTKDGVPVVIHDAELDRTTDAPARWGGKKIRVDSRTMDELRLLDAGGWFDRKNTGRQLPSCAGARVPSLAEALELIQDGNVTLIERKAGDAASCVKLLRERGLINKVVVQSFDWDYLKDFHRQEPGQALGALGPQGSRGGRPVKDEEKTLDPVWVDGARATGARVVVWNSQITREAVDYAHKQGLKVWVYTIDDVAVANRMLDMGVDGIITNNTSLLWRVLAGRQPKGTILR